jgi:hypothetical protein
MLQRLVRLSAAVILALGVFPAPLRGQEFLSIQGPLPEEAAIAEASREIDDLFKSELKLAEAAGRYFGLADKFRTTAAATPEDAHRFVLFSRAKDYCVRDGKIQDALLAIDDLSAYFRVDDLAMKADVLAACMPRIKSAKEAEEITPLVAGLLEDTVQAGKFDLAAAVSKHALSLSSTSKNVRIVRQAKYAAASAEAAAKIHEAYTQAQQTLTTQPNFEPARLAIGSYLCFVQGNWADGLNELATGSDEALRKAAALELLSPTSAEDCVTVAEGWWTASQRFDEARSIRDGVLLHALSWYRKALPTATGISKTRSSRRIEEIVRQLSYTTRISFASPQAANRLVFRYQTRKPPDPVDVWADPSRSDFWNVQGGMLRLTSFLKGNAIALDSSHAMLGNYFSSVSRIRVVGLILPPSTENYRIVVSPFMAIFNWEVGPENHLCEGEHRRAQTGPHRLVPGRHYAIEFRQNGSAIEVYVDGTKEFSTTGKLQGLISVITSGGSSIGIREIVVEGAPDYLRDVDVKDYPRF